jgi:hypothetical protein
LYPFLHTEINGVTVGTLCRTCSEAAPEQTECTHSNFERSFVSTVTSQEMAYGLTLGYLFDYFEMMVYAETSFFLRPFISLLAFEKLRHCEIPEAVDTEDKKADYCHDLNNRMNFNQYINKQLTPSMLQPNKQHRDFFKLAMNSLIGSFGANYSSYTTVEFLEYYGQLQKCIESKRLVDLRPLTDRILQVTMANKETYPSRTANVSISCSITSWARIIMHKHIQHVASLGATVMRVSCDAIYFLLDREVALPFTMSEAFGCFKPQFDNVQGIAQLGVKNLSVLYFDASSGCLREHLICSGAKLTEHNTIVLNHQTYKEQVEQMMHNEHLDFRSGKITMVHYQNQLKRRKITCVQREQIVFNNNLFVRRQYLSASKYYCSIPFGYVCTD